VADNYEDNWAAGLQIGIDFIILVPEIIKNYQHFRIFIE